MKLVDFPDALKELVFRSEFPFKYSEVIGYKNGNPVVFTVTKRKSEIIDVEIEIEGGMRDSRYYFVRNSLTNLSDVYSKLKRCAEEDLDESDVFPENQTIEEELKLSYDIGAYNDNVYSFDYIEDLVWEDNLERLDYGYRGGRDYD